MTREDSIRQIENYPPFNEQEEKDKALILGWISNNENAFSRENTVAHITASAWVVNKDRSKVLMVYHNIYNSWSWMGAYLPTVTRRAYCVAAMRQRMDTLFGGSLPEAVRALASESGASQSQLEQAIRVLEEQHQEAEEYDLYDPYG